MVLNIIPYEKYAGFVVSQTTFFCYRMEICLEILKRYKCGNFDTICTLLRIVNLKRWSFPVK